jgi:NADH-quinone oxidoreductase subunit G
MIPIKVNNFEFLVKPGISIIEACKYLGITIPRFCYHEILSVAGNCRMCLVELENIEKPIASCVTLIDKNLTIFTNTPAVKKARENVVETLLLNHPLDCPICDQAGECDLQDQSKNFGGNFSRFFFNKRGVEDKNCGPLIKTIMTRCIHCTRCVRFCSEIAGVDFLITLNRGTHTEIGGYSEKIFSSEISGNVIDLCPVGALTSKPYAFKARPWELRLVESIDVNDSLGSNIYVNFKETEITRILPKSNSSLNENLISDKVRFSYDAFKNNRIQNIFLRKEDKNDIKFFPTSNWGDALTKIDKTLKNTENVFFFVDDSTCLKTIELLKTLNRRYLNAIKFRTINNKKSNNLYFQGLKDTVTSVEKNKGTCFLLSSAPRLESAVLNARLRRNYRDKYFSIYSFGKIFDSNFPTNFVNLNIRHIISIFEGKTKHSSIFFNSKQPLLILGESLKKFFPDTQILISFLRSKFMNISFLKINSSSNTESSDLLNIQNISSKDISTLKLNKDVACIFINLRDSLFLRKYFNFRLSDSIWLNSHGSKIASKFQIILPTLTPFENEEIHVNLEGRPQKTQKIFNNFFNTRSIGDILSAIFFDLIDSKSQIFQKKNPGLRMHLVLSDWSNINNKNSHSLEYLYEITKAPELFGILSSKLLFKNLLNKSFFKQSININIFPLKSSIEDFHSSNMFTKNSLTMLNSSRLKRNISTNFID